MARIHSIQISDGGVPKLAVPEGIITFSGVAGDRQRNRKYHGGPDRAVCLFSLEVIHNLQKEGHPVEPGSTGENITIEGLDWAAIRPGDLLQIGGAVVEITADAKPCQTIAGSFCDGNSRRIGYKQFPADTRWYARVLREGMARPGDQVARLTEKPGQKNFNF